MGVLAKLLVKEFLKILIICMLVFIFLYLMIDFTGAIDNFIEANVPKKLIFSYYINRTPAIAVQMLPPACLITVIILFSMMKRNNEIIALKACGVSVWKISQPIMITSLFLSAALFLFSEVMVPYTSSKSNDLWRVEVNKQKPGRSMGRNDVWYKGSNCIYWIKQIDGEKKTMMEPSLYFFDDSFRLIKSIKGRVAIWKNGTWDIRDGIVQTLEEDGSYGVSKFQQLELRLPERPEDFVGEERKPEEMGYHQLKGFAERLRLEGYDATKYFVELNIKIAFPFIIVIMALVGIPIALWKRSMETPVAVCIGVGFCIAYLLILGLSRALGFGGILPPILAAWLANCLFFFLGIYLMIHVNH